MEKISRRQAGSWWLKWSSSSSRMRVMNHNWSTTKQHLHPQSVAEISHYSVLSGDRIRQCEASSGSRQRIQISVCKSPFPSAFTAVSLFRAKTVQQRPQLQREVETRWKWRQWLMRILTDLGFDSASCPEERGKNGFVLFAELIV